MFEESGARPLRVFFALPLPDDLGRTVATLQRTLERKARGLRWTPVENVHVTLKFLGNVQASDVRVLSEGLEQLTAGLPALTARATALGAFPSTRRARVFVLELGEPGGRIAELAKALDELAGRVGVLAETRPFRAHVTLARARPPLDLRELTSAAAFAPVPVTFDRVRLYRSTVGRAGSRYDVLHECALRAAGPGQ